MFGFSWLWYSLGYPEDPMKKTVREFKINARQIAENVKENTLEDFNRELKEVIAKQHKKMEKIEIFEPKTEIKRD